jgi:TPR repeat protein
MVDQPRYRAYEPDIDSLEQDINDLTNREVRPRPYSFGRTAQNHNEYQADSVPLFLSDPDGEPDPAEFDYEGTLREPRRFSVSAKILMTTIAASTVAVAFAWFSSDATRDMLISAKASIAAVLPVPSAAAQPEAAATTQLTAGDIQLKEPSKDSAQPVAPASQTPAATRAPQQQLAMLPSREDISSVYQSAAQSRAPAATPPAAAAPLAAVSPVAVVPPAAAAVPPAPQARRMDREELANLMQRAKGFLDTGDLPSARLLLERAADGQDANAALMLAQTYDPGVLGAQDIRNIVPEPGKARAWYQKAAQLGSADAQRRLAQLPN